MPTYESLLADASALPVDERIRLIEALWDSVPEDSLPPLSDAWVAEIQRRSAEYDSGTIETIPWEAVRAAAIEKLTEVRGHETD